MLDDRRMFVALAAAGSFSRAARQLGVARSTVMRRVDALEEELGLTLLHRPGTRIVLTEAGQRYAEALRPVLNELSRVEQRLLAEEELHSGPFRVWLPILGTASTTIAPAVAAFQRDYPGVTVHLEMGRDARQLELGAFDVAMQFGVRANPTLMVRTIFRERLILVATPEYIRERGLPASEEALQGHRAVHALDADGKLIAWRRPDGSRLPMPKPSVVANSVGVAYELARFSSGIAMAPMVLAGSAIDRGELVQVLPSVWSEDSVNFVYLPDPTATTRAFLDFITSWFHTNRSTKP